jgi:apolipoprotein N-acyltransferase
VAALAVPLALVAGTLAYAAARPAPAAAGTVRVALVQPGVIHHVEARFRASEAATLGLAGSRPDLVVWGESSVGRDPDRNPGDLVRIAAAARAVGAPVLVNVDADRAGGGGIYKSSILVGPDGRRLGSYDKMRLVPFGEYVPLRPLFGWVTRFTDAAAADRRRGTGLRVLPAGPVAAGPLVCFESAFPDLARNLAARGADLVVVQSATTTFQRSWGPDQHASLAAVRAVESGRPVVQAALSGVSAAFDARGRRLAWRPTSWRGAAVVELPRSGGTTLYVRFGDWLPRACCLALACAALAARSRRRRSRPNKEEALPSASEALQGDHR